VGNYDFIIAGGGAAGLSLAYEMVMSSLRGRSILVVDRDSKERNDRTWCYWSSQPTRYDHLAYRTWDQIEVISPDYHQVFDVRPYQYRMIRGIDFYQAVREMLAQVPGVELLQARINEVGDARDHHGARVMINEQPYGARYAFDSLFQPSDFAGGPKGYHYLKQHFKGWEIETTGDAFDPRVVTLFDFRTPQKSSMCFFYILPLTRRRALVEYTLFSASLLKDHEYDRAIAEYLEKVRGVTRYRIDAVEKGVIPMTDRPAPRRLSSRVMAIGTRGGLVKPSTGYAFLRVQKDAAAIVRSLVDHGHPFQVPPTPWRYRLFDTLMLQVMHRQGGQMVEIFTRLFQRNRIQEIFRFLDEVAPLPDNLRLISSLPKKPFLNALLRVKLLRKV
jgi:lycopene beta-cyclase